MSTVRCTVLSPIKFAGRVYRGGEVELPAAIAAEQERGGNVKASPVPVLTNPQGESDPLSPPNTPENQPAIEEAGTGDRGAAVTTEPAGGTTPPAGEAQAQGDRSDVPPTNPPETGPAIDAGKVVEAATVTTEPVASKGPAAGAATAMKPTKPKKATK